MAVQIPSLCPFSTWWRLANYINCTCFLTICVWNIHFSHVRASLERLYNLPLFCYSENYLVGIIHSGVVIGRVWGRRRGRRVLMVEWGRVWKSVEECSKYSEGGGVSGNLCGIEAACHPSSTCTMIATYTSMALDRNLRVRQTFSQKAGWMFIIEDNRNRNNAYVQYRSVNHQVVSDCSGETCFWHSP